MPHSEDELRTLLRESRAGGLIDPVTSGFTESVFSFGDRRAREVLVPRPEIEFITTDADLRAAVTLATETGHTRFPLCDPGGGLDAPVGVVNVKDLLPVAVERRELQLREVARPLPRVSESTLIGELLRELRRQHQHMRS